MTNIQKPILLDSASPIYAPSREHIPSKIQADTLFTFCTELDYILPSIEHKMIPPRYCEEDISFLNLDEFKKAAYPMKCFCDINLHRLTEHLRWYGYYGLAFTKEWGINNRIQPVQYINSNSYLCKDFSTAFSAAYASDRRNESEVQKTLKNYLLHEMMYYKPYDGTMVSRTTKEAKAKCFTDECEWRFIPDVTIAGYEQVYFDEAILNAGILNEISKSMFGIKEISLGFDYTDLKYIIVKTLEDFDSLAARIGSWSLGIDEERRLLSKIIVWDISKEDF